MKKKSLVLLMCICVLFGLLKGEVSAAKEQTEPTRVVKVGWYERAGYYEEGKDGTLSGFGVDYLNAIADYTGWQYEFVKGTRKQCITWVESGQIDLLSPVGMEEPVKNVKKAREVIGEDYGYIYKLNNNFSINFREYDKMDKVTLGIVNSGGLEENLARHCQENQISFHDVIVFDTLAEMRTALAEGRIDAMATDSYVNVDNVKVIGRFSNGRITFATCDDDILRELNQALENLKLNDPSFTEDLRKLYFSEGSQSDLEYSKEEREFLSTKHSYTVVLCDDQYPLSYISNEGNQNKGIALDIIKKLEHYTNIDFQIRYVKSHAEGERLLQEGNADMIAGCVVSKQEMSGNIGSDKEFSEDNTYKTEFYDMNMTFVGLKGTDMDEVFNIAVPSYFVGCLDQMKAMYPQYNFIIYDTDEECFEAILEKKVDVAIQSDLKINELIIYDKYKNLQNLKYVPGNYVAVFSIRTQDKLLVGVLNKALNSLSASARSAIVNNNIQYFAVQQLSFKELWRQYKGYIILFTFAIVSVNYALLGYRKFYQEQRSKERAYRDSIADISSMEKFRIDVEPILQGERKSDYYVIALDVDKFKVINDLYGYEQGDRVIAFLANVMKEELAPDDYITRSNADNFIVLKHSREKEHVEQYLEKVFQKVSRILTEKEVHYRMILKAGIYRVAEDDNNLSSIFDKANLAKQSIRQLHRSSYVFYDEEMRQKKIEDKTIENEMEEALQTGQFQVYLQPQVDLVTKKTVSAEALVRWIHPKKGLISPIKFIPVFEKNEFISRLDAYVWEEVIRTLVKWRDNHKVMVPIAINLSRVDVLKDGMIGMLSDLMKKYGLDKQWVKTELTESVCVDNDGMMMNRMHEIKDNGFKIAIDDFGSGYSSLHLLKKMPIDILKLDKSFLDFKMSPDLGMSLRDEIVIRDIVDMGKHLGLQIIVEGVETLEQSDFMEAVGCDIAQGYYYGKPMPVEEFEQRLVEEYGVGGMQQ